MTSPTLWSEGHRKRVRTLYGMAVGGFLVASGVGLLVWSITNEQIGQGVLALGAALVLCGLVAGAPQVWMPVLSAVLRKVPWGKATEIREAPTLVMGSLATHDDLELPPIVDAPAHDD